MKCPSCSLSISNAVSALSYYISGLFNSYTSNILPEAAALHMQIRLCLFKVADSPFSEPLLV